MFAFKTEPYKLTSYLSNELLYEITGIDGIAYPSRQQRHVGMNIVFHPNVINSFFTMKRIYKYRLINTDFEKGEFRISILEKGIVKGDSIRWSNNIDKLDVDYWEDLNPENFK